MSKDPNLNPVTVEYFCFNSDEVWKKSDSELIKLAEKELRQTQIIKDENIVREGFIVRSLDAYPVIAMGYEKNVNRIKKLIKNLFPIKLIFMNRLILYVFGLKYLRNFVKLYLLTSRYL